jgi:hypothetical protein
MTFAMTFEGIYTPVITPYTEDGEIDRDAFVAMIEHLVAAGVHGIINGGSTGEYYAQSMEERVELATLARQTIAGRVALIVGTGAIRQPDSILMAEHAAKIGADAILIGSPPYAVPTERENALNALAIDRAADLPVMLYNYPGRTGTAMGEEFLDRVGPVAQFLRHQGKLGRYQPRAPSGARLPAYPDVLRHGRPGAGILRMGRAQLGLRRVELPARRAYRALPGLRGGGRFRQGAADHVGDDAADAGARTGRQVRPVRSNTAVEMGGMTRRCARR